MAEETYPVRSSMRFKDRNGESIYYEPDYVERDADAPAGSAENPHKEWKGMPEQAEKLIAKGVIVKPAPTEASAKVEEPAAEQKSAAQAKKTGGS